MRPIHCGSNPFTPEKENIKSINDGLWTTLINSATEAEMAEYIEHSNKCMESILPKTLTKKISEYEKSQKNQIRSMRVLYESGLIGKRKYTSIRNSSDISCEPARKKRKNSKTEIMPGLTIPKILPYKTLMASLHAIDIGKVLDLSTLAAQLSLEPVHGVYRPLEPLLLKLADLYLQLHSSDPLLHWFNEEENVFWVAVGADGAPFGKDNTATG